MGSPCRRLMVALLAAAAASYSTVPALAAPPAPDAAELGAADGAVRARNWSAALSHFQAARSSAPSARAELGVADAVYRLGRWPEAYEEYAEAQRSYPKLAGADRATVTSRLSEIAAKTGWLSIRVGEAGAAVTVDGKPFGTSPVAALVRVVVGAHDVGATKQGFTAFAGRADVTADGKAVVDVDLAPAPSQGHLIVHASGDLPLRVLVDGVDVGVAPWEGDVAPGVHQVSGRSSKSLATAQPVTVIAGGHAAVDLAPSSTAAHLVLRTSDGKGLVTVDGAAADEGAFSGEVTPGVHTFSVSRDGYKPVTKSLTLASNETWAETVTLEPIAAVVSDTRSTERSSEGTYGGVGLAGALGVGGQGSELETNCDTLGASSCTTPSPFGGAVFGYVGWTWNPVGFELMLAATGDQTQQTAHFNGVGGSSVSLPFSDPARRETFSFVRFGAVAALRVRASTQGRFVRATVAGGAGLSYKKLYLVRRATATDGTGRQDVYSPDSLSYLSPAITVEGAVQFRVTPTLALSVGLEMWADSASFSGNTASPASKGHALAASGQTPAPIPTPQYHFASGAQVFLLPFIGMQFGP